MRDLTPETVDNAAILFPTRRAWWYLERHPLGFTPGANQGHGFYRAPNPPFGAVFTYYLKDSLKTQAKQRQDTEKPQIKDAEDTPYPGFEIAETERREAEPEVFLTVRDADGNVVRRVSGPTNKGIHRVAWDLRFPAVAAIPFDPTQRPTDDNAPKGYLAAPGEYTVSLSQRVNGVTTELASPQTFQVERLRSGALPGAEPREVVAFWQRLAKLQRNVTAASQVIAELKSRLDLLKQSIVRAHGSPADLDEAWHSLRQSLFEIEEQLSGNQAQVALGTASPASITSRLGKVIIGTRESTYGPTETHKDTLHFAETEFVSVSTQLRKLQLQGFPALEAALSDVDAPWTPGAALPEL